MPALTLLEAAKLKKAKAGKVKLYPAVKKVVAKGRK